MMSLLDDMIVKDVDVLVIGGGIVGFMVAVIVKEKNLEMSVLLLEKVNVKCSGVISMGMDGLNNVVVLGYLILE